MIAAEISMYKPDVMCLQGKKEAALGLMSFFADIDDIEVDQYDTFYKPLLEKLGYGRRCIGDGWFVGTNGLITHSSSYKAEHFTHPKKKHGKMDWIG